jgi:hypothetical protein
MVDTSGDTDRLLARATAAIWEARRLVETNLLWQAHINGGLKRMHFRASFLPTTFKIFSPLDVPTRRRPVSHDAGRYFSSWGSGRGS